MVSTSREITFDYIIGFNKFQVVSGCLTVTCVFAFVWFLQFLRL